MRRICSFAFMMFIASSVAFGQGGDKEFQVKGMLNQQDAIESTRNGYMKEYKVTMKAGKTYIIDMTSQQMLCYLRVHDSKGKLLDDGDGGGNLDARINFRCKEDGEYKVIAASAFQGGIGPFVLTVRPAGLAQAIAAHKALLEKPAPDFNADFALNGKPGWISELKGKVVILNFWEVRSSASRPVFSKLNDLQKTHRDAGLVVVGATFYPSDIDQRLAFDEKTGGVKNTDKADRTSDQALLTAFAKHHKMDYLQYTLSKQDALDVFNAYVVNGLPQLVLIDRKGMVRMVDINGDKNLESIETELKKLLEDK